MVVQALHLVGWMRINSVIHVILKTHFETQKCSITSICNSFLYE